MARQAILGGGKVPALWTMQPDVAATLHVEAEADTGYVGSGQFGIEKGLTLEQIEAMPWAMQYVSCDSEISAICRGQEYNGTCWIDREDYSPETKQDSVPGGRAKWHPGNRIHQVTGRVLAFIFLQALKDALTSWKEAEGYILPDEAWHVTEHYDKVRSNLGSMDDSAGACHLYDEDELGFICDKPLKVCGKLSIFFLFGNWNLC